MRESVLGDLARQAATDPEFLRHSRRDPAGTLARYGYQLPAGEMWRVEDGEEHTPRAHQERQGGQERRQDG